MPWHGAPEPGEFGDLWYGLGFRAKCFKAEDAKYGAA